MNLKRRRLLIIIGIFIFIGAIIGIIVAIISTNSSSSSSTKSSNNNDNDNSTLTVDQINKNTTSNVSLSNPDTAKPLINLLAIGDWGATIDKPGTCCDKYRKNPKDSIEYKIDYYAQINVAELLAQSAELLKPKAIIGHGDNIYWNGAGTKDIESRMKTTFENVYSQSSLKSIPWYNVLGNHDLGGAAYICGDSDGSYRKCTSVNEMLTYLELKFTVQQTYKSPNNDRWKLKDHYYMITLENNGVTIDIYNINTNYADSHGASQICCQCYGYSNNSPGVSCNSILPGNQYCAGGDMNMYNACVEKINKWSNDAYTKLKNDLIKSKSTYKIINSHYSPHFHMDTIKMTKWYKLCSDYNVHIWFNGHTHGFNHDISLFGTHFFENGGGGGIQSESSGERPTIAKDYINTEWIAPGNPYGYFELMASTDWLKVRFATFDNKWTFSTTKEQIVKGGIQYGHCWNIPRTGGKGSECK